MDHVLEELADITYPVAKAKGVSTKYSKDDDLKKDLKDALK
jgi:hypothetical protein